jgi:phosphoglucosamine mutase
VEKRFFGTDGIRGRVGIKPISADWILKLGWAVGRMLADKYRRGRVLIGKDTRISGYMFESALEAGLAAAGADTLLLGPMPTPGISYLTRTLKCNLGIVISASHNPHYDNGIKFFAHDGLKLSDAVELAIEQYLEQPLETVASANIGRAARIVDASGRYIEFCKSSFPQTYTLEHLKIVLDCANGAAYHVAPDVFRELGAKVTVIGDSPNGLNINLNYGSTALANLQAKVLATGSDLGIAFDGDGDRVLFIDHQGNLVDGDQILFIIARYYQQIGKLRGGLVATVMSNLGLEQACQAANINFMRSSVGDRYVMEALLQRAWNLGGEPSGHIVCLDYHNSGDGIIAALQVLAALCQQQISLMELARSMQKYPQVLVNVQVEKGARIEDNPVVMGHIAKVESLLANNGRLLVRRSGTEPLIRIMIEGNDAATIELLAQELAELIRAELA